MDAQDPLLRTPWQEPFAMAASRAVALNPSISILSHCFGEVGRRMDALSFVNGKLLPLLCLPSSSVHLVSRMRRPYMGSSA